MYAGVPIEKTSMLRYLFERSGHSSTEPQHLKKYIPMIEANEMNQIIKEVENERDAYDPVSYTHLTLPTIPLV